MNTQEFTGRTKSEKQAILPIQSVDYLAVNNSKSIDFDKSEMLLDVDTVEVVDTRYVKCTNEITFVFRTISNSHQTESAKRTISLMRNNIIYLEVEINTLADEFSVEIVRIGEYQVEISFPSKEESEFILSTTNSREDLFTIDILDDDSSANINDKSTTIENMYITDSNIQALPQVVVTSKMIEKENTEQNNSAQHNLPDRMFNFAEALHFFQGIIQRKSSVEKNYSDTSVLSDQLHNDTKKIENTAISTDLKNERTMEDNCRELLVNTPDRNDGMESKECHKAPVIPMRMFKFRN